MSSPRNPQTSIKFPVFNDHVIKVLVVSNMERTGRAINADLSGCVAAFVEDLDNVRLSRIVFSNDLSPNTIAHEAAHAIRHMLKVSGVRVDDEVFAYHLGHLVGEIHKFLERKGLISKTRVKARR